MIGLEMRDSSQKKAPSSSSAAPPTPSVRAESKPYSVDLTIAKAPSIVASVIRTDPATSTPPARPMPRFSSISAEPSTNANTPIGTFTKKIQCQSQRLRQRAPGEQPDRAAPGGDERVQAHRLRLLGFLGELRDDDREDHRRGHRAADPLHEATGDQHRLAVRDAAEHRGGSEQDQPGEEDFLAADQIAHPSSEQQEAAEGDQIRVDHPREVALGEVQVVLDRGQRDVDDRRVEHHHQLAEAQHSQCDPAAALAAPCGLRRARAGRIEPICGGAELICGGAHDDVAPFGLWRGHTIARIILVVGMVYIKFIIVAKVTTDAKWCKITLHGC